MKQDEPTIDQTLRKALAPAPRAQVDAGVERAYARIRSLRPGHGHAGPDAQEGSIEAFERHQDPRRRLKGPVTFVATAATIALAIWMGVSTRSDAIAVLEA